MFEFALLVFASCCCCSMPFELTEMFAWKQVDFVWPDWKSREDALHNGEYIPVNNLPMGLGLWKNKFFITVPRWKKGVPSTLNYIDLHNLTKSPNLIPYPNWKINALPEVGNKEGNLISLFRFYIDQCDRLWVVDTGSYNILNTPERLAPISIIIFDLKSDLIIRRYQLKQTDVSDSSFLAYITVDVTSKTCDNAYAYIPDLRNYRLIVYSYAHDNSWTFSNNYFNIDPLKGDYNVAGLNFQLSDGIFSISYSSIKRDGFRKVYFHALGSTKEFSVSSQVLQNRSAASDINSYHLFRLEGDKGHNTQSSACDIDDESQVYFFTQPNRNAIACWNTRKLLHPRNVGLVVQDDEKLIFPNDLKIFNHNIYTISDKLPVFFYSQIDENIINYRIFNITAKEAIMGTPCA